MSNRNFPYVLKGEIPMKRTAFTLFLISIFLISLGACAGEKSDLAVMSYGVTEEHATIVWEDSTYVPYGPISKTDCGKQIGFIDGNETDKVYEFKDYPPSEWIITALPHDPAMLWREIKVTDIPEGLDSEYEWNN